EGEQTFQQRCVLLTQLRVPRQDDVAADMLDPEPGGGNDELLSGRDGLMRNGKEGGETGGVFPPPRVLSERPIRNELSRLMQSEPNRSAGEKPDDVDSLGRNRRRGAAEGHANAHSA